MKEIIILAKEKVKAYIDGPMGANITAAGRMISWMDTVMTIHIIILITDFHCGMSNCYC